MNRIGTLTAVLLLGTVFGGSAALAQTPTAPNSGAGVPGLPGNKSGPAMKPGEESNVRPDQSNVPGLLGNKSGPAQHPPSGLQNRVQGNEEEDEDQGGFHPPGMMGMMGHGMMNRGHWQHDWHQGPDFASLMMMRMIFGLMDADGDGKLTLQEFQAAHERIFKAMDTDHDGTVTFEEMQAFIRGH